LSHQRQLQQCNKAGATQLLTGSLTPCSSGCTGRRCRWIVSRCTAQLDTSFHPGSTFCSTACKEGLPGTLRASCRSCWPHI
jgi:hypothetical protein